MAPGTGDVPTIEHLQDLLLESPGFTEFLLGLTTISASRLGGANPMLCAITVERNGSPATVASSDEDALPMDEKQYVYDDGPCLTALRQQHTVLVPDLGNDSRWKRYAKAVPGEGIRSVLAVPIRTVAGSAAALNCYSRSTDAFDDATSPPSRRTRTRFPGSSALRSVCIRRRSIRSISGRPSTRGLLSTQPSPW